MPTEDEPALAITDAADAGTLRSVYERDYPKLLGLALLLVSDRADAEEVVNEAFVRVLSGWESVTNKADPSAYVRTAVVNVARGYLRRRRTRGRWRAERLESADLVEQAVAAKERQREVVDAARRLPRRQRECVVLRYYLEYSTEETAQLLGISPGSVKTHLHRALTSIEKPLRRTS